MKLKFYTFIYVCLCAWSSTTLNAQSVSDFKTDYVLFGIGTNVGNYKINHKNGDLNANLHDIQMPGLNMRFDYFVGFSKNWQVGGGLEFILFNHLFKVDYKKYSNQLFKGKYVHTNQFGYEIPLYFQRLFSSKQAGKKFAIAIGPRYSYFYGHPTIKEQSGSDNYTFRLKQSYKFNNNISRGFNYSLFAEFSLFRKLVNNNWLQMSFNYTHYFVHSQFGLYSIENSSDNQVATGEIKAYCNYVLLNIAYCFSPKKKETTEKN